jgi:cytochrome c biogenesis protein CcmG/thiol:disulfide interchange protein DsbE
MMKKPVLVTALVAFALVAGCTPTRSHAETTPAPDFSLKDLQGRTVSLADYKGKVLVLNFWATWCPPCRAEIPDFIEAYKDLKAKGLEILGLSVENGPPAKLREWTEKVGINYPVAVATPQVVAAYQPGDYVPSTIIVDRKGQVRYRNVGAMDKETLARLFKEFSD